MKVNNNLTLDSQIKNAVYQDIRQNTTQTTEKTKNKRQKIAAVSLGAAVVVGSAGILLQPRLFGKKISRFIGDKTGKISRSIQNFIKKIENPKIKAFGEEAFSKTKNAISSFLNFSNNMASCKDVYTKTIWNTLPFLKWFDTRTSKLYQDTGIKMTRGAYKKVSKLFASTDEATLGALSQLAKKGNLSQKITIKGVEKTLGEWIQTSKQLLKAKGDNLAKLVDDTSFDARLDKIEQATQGIAKKTRTVLNKAFKERDFKVLKEKFVAEDLLSADKKALIEELSRIKQVIKKSGLKCENGSEILLDDILKSIGADSKKIAPLQRRSARALEKATIMEGNNLFDKIRDIKGGCAPMDICSILGTGALTGIYLGQAKSKQERVSVALTSGIPLTVGVASSTIATMKMITGSHALLIGLASGFVANTIGRAIDKIYRKKTSRENEEVSIPTLKLEKV